MNIDELRAELKRISDQDALRDWFNSHVEGFPEIDWVKMAHYSPLHDTRSAKPEGHSSGYMVVICFKKSAGSRIDNAISLLGHLGFHFSITDLGVSGARVINTRIYDDEFPCFYTRHMLES